MKYINLQKGEIYTVDYCGNHYIFQHTPSSAANLHNETFYNSGGDFSIIGDAEVNFATPDEKEHLLQCIQARKFIPLNKLRITYEIY